MIKKSLIFAALLIGLLVLLMLWFVDKVSILEDSQGSFHFFRPSPRPLSACL